jgi:hypothetical protein
VIADRSTIAKPVAKRETVKVPSLGCDVLVRQLTLSEKLALANTQERGELAEKDFIGILAAAVLDCHAAPLFTEEEWEVFGSNHLDEAMNLINVVFRLSGMSAEAKKSVAADDSSSPAS